MRIPLTTRGMAVLAVLLCTAVAVSLSAVAFVGRRSTPHGSHAVMREWKRNAHAVPEVAETSRREAALAGIDVAVLGPWETALERLDTGALDSLLPSGAALRWFRAGTATPGPSHFTTSKAATPSNGTLAPYLACFHRVEHASLDVEKARFTPDMRHASLEVRYDLRGLTQEGQRRNDRGLLRIQCEARPWRVSRVEALDVETVSGARALFRDVTAESGLAKVPTYLRLEAIRRGGYALAVSDYNGDGRADLYIGAWGKGRLYRNNGGGRYEDVTDRSGLGNDTLVKAAAFVDLTNSGRKDLILTRFVDDASKSVVIYRNNGDGTFSHETQSPPLKQAFDRAMPMTAGDFNGDGLTDLYVGFPGARDFTIGADAPQRGTPQGVLLNLGARRFLDATLASMVNERWSHGQAVYPHTAMRVDWDLDGYSDLLVVDDRRNPTLVLKGDGKGHFSDASATSGIDNQAWGMGAAVGDYDGDGLPDVFFSNIDFLAARRLAEELPAARKLVSGNRLYRNLGNGRFEDVTDRAGLRWSGDAAGGCAWIDYNGDGRLDLYVTNGLWTGGRSNDLASLFIRQQVAERVRSASAGAAPSERLETAVDEKQPTMRLLQTYRGTLLTEDGNSRLSLGGNQRNCLFHNNGDGTFTEVGYVAGVDAVEDGYMPAVGDCNGDGRPDLFLRNADPGTRDHLYPPVRLFRNASEKRYLAVHPRGTGRSNRDAIGAIITLWAGGQRQTRVIESVNGATQGDGAAYFGLGETSVDRIEIRWPSGRMQVFRGPLEGPIQVVEGRPMPTVLRGGA